MPGEPPRAPATATIFNFAISLDKELDVQRVNTPLEIGHSRAGDHVQLPFVLILKHLYDTSNER